MSVSTSENRLAGYFSLFASLGTLVCCALPALLVLLGLGATVASALSAMPWLVALSRHKEWVFGLTGALIAANFYYVYRVAPRLQHGSAVCPPGEETACAAASRTSRWLLLSSATVYVVGFVVAFLLGPLLAVLDQRS